MKYCLISLLMMLTSPCKVHAASFLFYQTGQTTLTLNDDKDSNQRIYKGHKNRLHYIESVPNTPSRYGIYLQTVESQSSESEDIYLHQNVFKTYAFGIETSFWIPQLSFLEFIAGFSLQTAQFSNMTSINESNANIDNSATQRTVQYTQGLAGRIGLSLSPSLGPLALSVEAGGELGRFTNGTDSKKDYTYLPKIVFQSTSILAGARIRF